MKLDVIRVSVTMVGLSLPAVCNAGPAYIGNPQLDMMILSEQDDGDVYLSRCGHEGDRPRPAPSTPSEGGGGEFFGGSDGGLTFINFADDCADFGPNPTGLSDRTTDKIVEILTEANVTCGPTSAAYQIDCLRAYYGRIADSLPNTGDYAPVKKALKQAEKKLDQIVRNNLDVDAPRIRPNKGNKRDAARLPPLRAVKASALPEAKRQAEAVVKEAELLIVRSGGDPARRKPHYDEIAGAVEDNLVILRSA